MINPTAIACLLSAAVAGGGAYQWQANRYEAKLATIQTEYAQAQARAVETAHADTIRLQAQADHAQANAAVRVRTAVADRDLLRAAVDRLRDTADTALRESSDSIAACTAHGATITELFGQCASRYGEVAGAADQAVSEVILLREAWPK